MISNNDGAGEGAGAGAAWVEREEREAGEMVGARDVRGATHVLTGGTGKQTVENDEDEDDRELCERRVQPDLGVFGCWN